MMIGDRTSQMATYIGVIMVIGAGGCSSQNPAVSEKPSSKPVPVRTVSVVQQEVRRTTMQPATVHPYYRAEIRAIVSGYVKQLHADIGDFVEAGAVLAVVDVPEMRSQWQVLQARLDRSKAEEQRTEAGVSLAESAITAARASHEETKSQLLRAEALLTASEAEFNRVNDLVERRSLESRMLDESRKKRDSERANKRAVQSSIISAAANVRVAQAKKRSAEADLAAARAETAIIRRQLEELEVLLNYATIRAPFGGVVTARSVDPGDLVRERNEVGSGEPLFVVSRMDKVRIHVPVPEADAALVNPGDVITLTFPSFPEEEIQAEVTRLSHSLDPSTRTMLIEAELDNEDRKLLPGMFGQASIVLSTKVAANLLPARAIRFNESGESFVYVVGADETISIVDVKTGIDDGLVIEILEGVGPDQHVVDAHLRRFTNGQAVSIVND